MYTQNRRLESQRVWDAMWCVLHLRLWEQSREHWELRALDECRIRNSAHRAAKAWKGLARRNAWWHRFTHQLLVDTDAALGKTTDGLRRERGRRHRIAKHLTRVERVRHMELERMSKSYQETNDALAARVKELEAELDECQRSPRALREERIRELEAQLARESLDRLCREQHVRELEAKLAERTAERDEARNHVNALMEGTTEHAAEPFQHRCEDGSPMLVPRAPTAAECATCAADETVTPGLCEHRAGPASGKLLHASPVLPKADVPDVLAPRTYGRLDQTLEEVKARPMAQRCTDLAQHLTEVLDAVRAGQREIERLNLILRTGSERMAENERRYDSDWKQLRQENDSLKDELRREREAHERTKRVVEDMREELRGLRGEP